MRFAAHYAALHVEKLMQHCFVLTPQHIYEEIIGLCPLLIEWGDDIIMKQLCSSFLCLLCVYFADTSSCLD